MQELELERTVVVLHNVKENNWLGQGKSVAFEIEVDRESLAGVLSYVDPNYDFWEML